VRSTTYFFLAIVSSSRGRLLCSLITSRSAPHNPSDRVLGREVFPQLYEELVTVDEQVTKCEYRITRWFNRHYAK